MFLAPQKTFQCTTFSRILAYSSGRNPRTMVVCLLHTTSLNDRIYQSKVHFFNNKYLFHALYIFLILTEITLLYLGGWNPVGESPADQPLSFKCDGLINKKEYKFRIVAVNKMGHSEPCLYPKIVLAKDPWGKFLFSFNDKR